MILGAVLMLVSEALVFRSLPMAIWLAVFIAANALYLGLIEEESLEACFGAAYIAYREHVPAWLTMCKAWRVKDG
jgi:protein-S-isoprenylcysteine O-methyltransferase Ste14